MEIKIIDQNGKLLISKGNETIFPYGYMTYLDSYNDDLNFSKIGCNLFLSCLFLGEHGVNESSGIEPFKKGLFCDKNHFDYSSIDESVETILKNNANADIILRINLNAPDWWRNENQDELVRCSDNSLYMQSLASKKWLQFAKDCLNKIVSYIQTKTYKNHIIGYHLAGQNTEEWIAIRKGTGLLDTSLPFLSFYHRQLKIKYGSLAYLNQNYRSDYHSFEEIGIPDFSSYISWEKEIIFSEESYLPQMDYLTIFNQASLLAIQELTSYMKSIVKNQALVGVFYGYIGQLNATYGHLFIDELIRDPNIDFFASPVAYNHNRQGANDFFYHSIMNDAYLRHKLWFIENDIRTCHSSLLTISHPELTKSESAKKNMSLPTWLGPKTKEESLSVLKRAFSKCLLTNQPYWWFDMWGDFYRDNDFYSLFAKCFNINKTFTSQNNNEIAVIFDEFASLTTNELRFYDMSYSLLSELSFVGCSYDLYSIHTAKENLNQYKVLIYILPSKKQRERLGLKNKQANYIIGQSIYSLKDKASHQELIDILKKEKVHLYSPNHIVYQSKNAISITSTIDGIVDVHFQKTVHLVNMFDEKETYHSDHLSLEMKYNQTKVFYIR